MRRFALITLLAVAAPFAGAQRFAAPRAVPRFGPAGHARSFFYPLVYGDPFFSDYLSTGYPVASQPPVIVLQAPPVAAAPAHPAPPIEPLMIELQGDRYVRVSGPENEGGATIDRIPEPPANVQAGPARKPAASLDQRSLLIFRDGHREEVSDYTIADGVLYTHANLYTDGSWTRPIPLSSLNLPETIALNQSRAVAFRIPSSPNEVIIRP